MHEPTHAALLRGVIGALEDEVVPVLEAGAAQRQLKAALVILRRMERAADREGAYLEAEADDTLVTLRRVLERESDDAAAAALARRLATIADRTAAVTDTAAARERDARLQALAVDVEAHVRERRDPGGCAELRHLHHRMLERQDRAWGTARAAAS
ncbi:MAG: hypothetical protein JWP18_1781 [Solirubrobacterales bacterium]|nr:hypothetical protein [Solirubrobacterales bacterium]